MIEYNPIIQNFTTKEKHACFLALTILVASGEPRFKDARSKILNDIGKMFRIFPIMFREYADNTNLSEMGKDLRKLSADKQDYLFALTHVVLNSTGITKQDLINIEALFSNLIGIFDPDNLYWAINKLTELQTQPTQNNNFSQASHTNTVSKAYDRMIREAQDPNQSSFSLNNIVFLVFTVLAILGLVSLCS